AHAAAGAGARRHVGRRAAGGRGRARPRRAVADPPRARRAAGRLRSRRARRGGVRASRGRAARRAGGRAMSAATDVVRQAVEQVGALTSRDVEGVLGVRRNGDGWVVTVEVVEMRRIPDSTDVLGAYEVHVDTKGELTEYRRTRRYYRSQVEEER